MYTTPNINALPAAGAGTAISAAQSGQFSLWIVAVLLLGAWTVYMAMKAVGRIVPRVEQ